MNPVPSVAARLRSLHTRFDECSEAIELARESHGLADGHDEVSS